MAPRILHLHSSFRLGGPQARAVRLMSAWGPRARHTIVSATPEELGARAAIASGVAWEVAQDPPPLAGRPSVARFEALAGFARGFDLVLTYGWGAVDGAMARRVFGRGAPPVVHHEDEADDRIRPERTLYRRVALSVADALIVPSADMARAARLVWRQPTGRLHHVPNGVPLAPADRRPDSIPGLSRRKGEVVIGTVATFRAAKDLPLLVRAVGGLPGRVRLVIVGDGPERAAVATAAAAMGLEDRLVLPGALPDPHLWLRQFDVAAVSSAVEQHPTFVAEAMAAGLPVATTPVGEVAEMLSEANRPFVTSRSDEVMLRDVIQALAVDAELRRTVGAANRARAEATLDEAAMIERYAAIYEGALGRPGALRG